MADTPPNHPAAHARRLEHLADLCARGLVASAELELHTWRREPDCPPAATTLLAALLAQRGRDDDARRLLHALHELPDDQLDPQQGVLLIAVLLDAGHEDAADRLAERLAARHADDPAAAEAMRMLGYDALTHEPTDRAVVDLVQACIEQPAILSAIVAGLLAQPAHPADQQTHLATRTAAQVAAPHIHQQLQKPADRAALCLAMARLAAHQNEIHAAGQWAQLGLADQPAHPRLALVLADLDDDPALGPPARQHLAHALRRHPHYPDLRVAYIRRCRRDGREASAKRRLAAWLRRDPRSPIAIELQQEVAA
ncbi:MAG: hypothetical protein AAF823_14680 [Planctomycetota bacterium]